MNSQGTGEDGLKLHYAFMMILQVIQLFQIIFFKGGRRLQIDLGAGEPPPSHQCLPRRVAEERI